MGCKFNAAALGRAAILAAIHVTVFGYQAFGVQEACPTDSLDGQALSLLQTSVRFEERRRARAAPGDWRLPPVVPVRALTGELGPNGIIVFHFDRVLSELDEVVVDFEADAESVTEQWAADFLGPNGDVVFTFNPQPKKRVVLRNAQAFGQWGDVELRGGWPFGNAPKAFHSEFRWTRSSWHVTANCLRHSELDFARATARPVALRLKGHILTPRVSLRENKVEPKDNAPAENAVAQMVTLAAAKAVAATAPLTTAQVGLASTPEPAPSNSQNRVLAIAPVSTPHVGLASAPQTAPNDSELIELHGENVVGSPLALDAALPRPPGPGDKLIIVADATRVALGPRGWAVALHDAAGNIGLGFNPRAAEQVVGRNAMAHAGAEDGGDLWGLEEVSGAYPLEDGTVRVELAWTWSLWAVTIGGTRRPDLDFYHRMTSPMTRLTLTAGLVNPKVYMARASRQMLVGAPFSCDQTAEGHKLVELQRRPSADRSASWESSFHSVVGDDGALMISLARKPERFEKSSAGLALGGILATAFPATDAKCSTPDGLDMGMRRKAARLDASTGKAQRRAAKLGQTVDQWWGETRVAQAIADSHRRALQAALARGPEHPWTAILEDDVELAGDLEKWDSAFAKAWASIGPNVTFVRLGWCGSGPPYRELFRDTGDGMKVGQWIASPPEADMMHAHDSDGGCTTGYLVHRSVIPEMLTMFPCREVVDSCFLWKLFMSKDEGSQHTEWGAVHLANIDTNEPQLPKASAHAYIQRGVLRQATGVPSTRRNAAT